MKNFKVGDVVVLKGSDSWPWTVIGYKPDDWNCFESVFVVMITPDGRQLRGCYPQDALKLTLKHSQPIYLVPDKKEGQENEET